MMKLSTFERSLLVTIHLRGELDVSEIAKMLRVKPHVVHYALGRLKDLKIIRRGILVNIAALNLRSHQILFALHGAAPGLRTRLLSELKGHPHVSWFAELGGAYQYGVTLSVSSPEQALETFSSIQAKLKLQLVSKSATTILNFTALQKTYIDGGKIPAHRRESVSAAGGFGGDAPDELDRKILGVLSDPSGPSNREISQKLGVPRATIDRRIQQMRECNVLKAETYFINAVAFGCQVFRLLLKLRSSDSKISERIAAFCLNQPRIVNWSQCFGGWDFELGVDAAPEAPVTDISDLLFHEFGEVIHELSVIPVFSQATSARFLVADSQRR